MQLRFAWFAVINLGRGKLQKYHFPPPVIAAPDQVRGCSIRNPWCQLLGCRVKPGMTMGHWQFPSPLRRGSTRRSAPMLGTSRKKAPSGAFFAMNDGYLQLAGKYLASMTAVILPAAGAEEQVQITCPLGCKTPANCTPLPTILLSPCARAVITPLDPSVVV